MSERADAVKAASGGSGQDPLADACTPDRLAILRRLNGVRGYRCRVDKLGKISEDDLAALVDRGLVEHVRTAPMVVAEQWGGPHSIEDVAVYGITKAGRRIVQAYNDEAGKQRLAREGRQAA